MIRVLVFTSQMALSCGDVSPDGGPERRVVVINEISESKKASLPGVVAVCEGPKDDDLLILNGCHLIRDRERRCEINARTWPERKRASQTLRRGSATQLTIKPWDGNAFDKTAQPVCRGLSVVLHRYDGNKRSSLADSWLLSDLNTFDRDVRPDLRLTYAPGVSSHLLSGPQRPEEQIGGKDGGERHDPLSRSIVSVDDSWDQPPMIVLWGLLLAVIGAVIGLAEITWRFTGRYRGERKDR